MREYSLNEQWVSFYVICWRNIIERMYPIQSVVLKDCICSTGNLIETEEEYSYPLGIL